MTKHSNEPQNIDRTNWYYEERSGVTLIHEVYDENKLYVRTDRIVIPWRMLKATMQRHGESKKVSKR